MARFGVPVGGRVRKPRAVEDHSAPTPEDITSKLGENLIGTWSLDARSEGQSGYSLPRERRTEHFSLGLFSFSILITLDQQFGSR